ncbi:hypothetical protein ACF0H5_008133 [Mactra antiquata]
MAARRKASSKQRNENENVVVRFDYSSAHLDNEFLTNELEDREFELWREKQRMCAETNESIKKAKKDANDMQQLKDAVQKRDPNESPDRVVKSADYKKRPSLKNIVSDMTKSNAELGNKKQSAGKDLKSSDDVDEIDGSVKTEKNEKGESDTFKSKPLNTLTMFLLSIQNFKRAGNQAMKNESNKNTTKPMPTLPEGIQGSKDGKTRKDEKGVKGSAKGRKGDKGTKLEVWKRPASYHAGQTRVVDRRSSIMENRPESQYGIHTKKDHTRSRRKLEEICRIEQDYRYGPVNKYEERRRKLLSASKDTKSLDDRIKHFLKDVEDFNTLSRDENSLEKVLLRTKSHRLSRANTFAW